MTNKGVTIAVLIAFLTGAVGGFIVGKGTAKANLATALAKSFAEGQQKTKSEIGAKFAEQGLGGSVDEPVHSVYGFVKDVSSSGFTIEYDTAQFSFVESGKLTKNVSISGTATLQKMISLPTPAPTPVTAPASGAANDGHPTGGPGSSGGLVAVRLSPDAPEPKASETATFEQKMQTIALSDLRPGDYVQVTSSNDIRTSDNIDAVAAIAYDKNTMPPEGGNDPSKLPFARGGGSLEGKPFIPTK